MTGGERRGVGTCKSLSGIVVRRGFEGCQRATGLRRGDSRERGVRRWPRRAMFSDFSCFCGLPRVCLFGSCDGHDDEDDKDRPRERPGLRRGFRHARGPSVAAGSGQGTACQLWNVPLLALTLAFPPIDASKASQQRFNSADFCSAVCLYLSSLKTIGALPSQRPHPSQASSSTRLALLLLRPVVPAAHEHHTRPMSSKRGRKRNDNLPPNRARDVQRAFRARRAAHLEVRFFFEPRSSDLISLP